MRPQLSCADFTFPLLEHDDVLTLIKALAIPAIDIGLMEDRSHLQPSEQFRNVSRSAGRLREKLEARGLRAADVFLIPGVDAESMAINHPLASRRRKARDWFLRTLEYAAVCGAGHVTGSTGIYIKGQSRSRSWAESCEELAWRVERARQQGMPFGVEPAIGTIVPRPKSALRLIDDVPGLTYTLDYSHFTRVGVTDREVEPLIQHASHFHVRGARKGALQATFDDNTIDFKRIMRVMKQTGYRGYLCLEYVWTVWENCNQVDNLSETIRFRDFLKSVRL